MKKLLDEIDAYIYGQKIGTLILHEDTIYFQYEKKFSSMGIEISPLKLNTSDIKALYTNHDSKSLYQGMPGVFFDSLPDKHGMAFIDRYYEGEGLKSSQISLLEKLAFIGNRGMGAIEYRPQLLDDNKDIDRVLAVKDVYEKMKNMLGGDGDISSIDELMSIMGSVSPLGGGKPKMLIMYNQDTQTIKFNNLILEEGFKRCIIKFDEVYYEDESMGFTKQEYLYMTMASECGINTAKTHLIAEDGRDHLIVERFDRDDKDNKTHISTASGLMHKDISIAKVISYDELFEFTMRICNDHKQIIELFRRMVFNAVCINFDDHAKNFSFIMDRKGAWKLSPAYDITYSKGLAVEHATTISGVSIDFKREDFMKIARTFSINQNIAKGIIDVIISKLSTYAQRAKISGLEDADIQDHIEDIDKQIELLG